MAITSKSKSSPIRALIDVVGGQRNEKGELWDRIPPAMFGSGRPKLLRKLVLIAIAASADADGSNAFPSRETIAHRCMVGVRAVAKAIRWLKENGLLKVESKAASTGKFALTNRYTILWPTDPADTSSGEAPQANPEGQGTAVPGTNTKGQGTAVPSASEGQGTAGVSTGNDAAQHQEQSRLGQGTAVPPTVLVPCDRKKEPKNNAVPLTSQNPATGRPQSGQAAYDLAAEYAAYLEQSDLDKSTRKKPSEFVPSDEQAWQAWSQTRLAVFKQYRTWFCQDCTGQKVPLSAEHWRSIRDVHLSTTCDLTVFRLATEDILSGGVNAESSYERCNAAKVVAGSLADFCAAILAKRREDELNKQLTKQLTAERQVEVDREIAEAQRKREEEARLADEVGL